MLMGGTQSHEGDEFVRPQSQHEAIIFGTVSLANPNDKAKRYTYSIPKQLRRFEQGTCTWMNDVVDSVAGLGRRAGAAIASLTL